MTNSIRFKMLIAVIIILFTWGCTNSIEKYKETLKDSNKESKTITATDD